VVSSVSLPKFRHCGIGTSGEDRDYQGMRAMGHLGAVPWESQAGWERERYSCPKSDMRRSKQCDNKASVMVCAHVGLRTLRFAVLSLF